MARVNGYISDLFFNTDLDRARKTNERGDFAGFDDDILAEEAASFLACLAGLGVPNTPTSDELIADFHGRV